MMGSVNDEVAAELASHPLTRLTHFTPAMNLPNIISDGRLRSVKDLDVDVRAYYRATDPQRFDGHPDKVCCSLQYPNGFYFDKARGKDDLRNYPHWVCLLIDKFAAAVNGTLFCPRNAAAAASLSLPGTLGLRACYAQYVDGQGGFRRSRGPQHDPGSPTDVQAEVLIPAPVHLSAIKAIVFPAEAAAEEEYGRLDRFGLLPPAHVSWVVSPGMFSQAMTTNAVRFSRYFPETNWQRPVIPEATP